MNDRQRFNAVMHYKPVDRIPLYDFSFWDETLPEWHKQGLPSWVQRKNAGAYFGLDASLAGGDEHDSIECSINLLPSFPYQVLEDRGDHELVQQSDGVRVLRKKYMGSIPMHEGHLLTDRDSWNKHYKPRLDPTDSRRLPANFKEKIAYYADPNRSRVLHAPCGSLYGWIRNWMGVEQVSYVVHDDPALFEEMVVTLADVTIATLTPMLEAGAKPDLGAMWEDMCYNSGPLLSPVHFKKYMVPQYRRISSLLRKHGCDVLWIDCDGYIDDLAPLWLEAGINCMFPLEVGTWMADPIDYRKRYGKNMLIMGGFDKHLLQGTKPQIEKEIHRLTPLVEDGGFIPMPDHRVPPDVPLENYEFYCDTIRNIWGKGINLRPRFTQPGR